MSPSKPKLSLGERLTAKLESLGLHPRKASELAKGLVPTITHIQSASHVGEKLLARLARLGVTERKAKEMVKKIQPLAKATIHTKTQARLGTVLQSVAEKKLKKASELPAEAPADAVTSLFALKLDEPILPVSQRGTQGVDIGRVMHGLTSTRSYIVVAVKGNDGIIAVRRLSQQEYNVKFYPTLAYWDQTVTRLESLNAVMFLKRDWYERMHFAPEGVQQLLDRMAAEAEGQTTKGKLKQWWRATVYAPLAQAFNQLYGHLNGHIDAE